MIKAVVFDLDNTVYDYDACHQQAMKRLQDYAFIKFGVEGDLFQLTFDRAKKMVKEQLGNTGSSHNRMLYMQVFLELLGRKPVDGALDLYDEYWNTMLDAMEPYPYVLPLMEALRERGIIIAVLTDLTAHIQHRKIKQLGLADYIDVMVTSEEAGQEKPSSVTFEMILKKLSSRTDMEPEEVLMVGDSQQKDVDGAAMAGMKGLLYRKSDAVDMDRICLRYINHDK